MEAFQAMKKAVSLTEWLISAVAEIIYLFDTTYTCSFETLSNFNRWSQI